jgi:hypothetical protein
VAARFELLGEILGRAAGARQLDDPGPELGGVRGAASRHTDTLLRKSEGVHQTGATPTPLYGTLYFDGNGNVFDQILVSPGLLTGASGLRVVETTARPEAFPDMTSERRKVGPVRFGLPPGDAAKNVTPDGIADHFPVSVTFV